MQCLHLAKRWSLSLERAVTACILNARVHNDVKVEAMTEACVSQGPYLMDLINDIKVQGKYKFV